MKTAKKILRWIFGTKEPTPLVVGDSVRTDSMFLVGRVKEVREAIYVIEWWRIDRPDSPICTTEHKKENLL